MNSLSRVRNGSALMLALSALWSASVCAADDAGAFDHVQQIQAGDLNIGYVDIGPRDGQPVILLHGWPYDIHSYEKVAPALAQKGFRVIVPYLRGYGTTRFLSAKTPRNGQPSAMAADIIHLMDALQIKQADVAGFDWGARTADIMAALWPERVKSLVSVSGYLIGSRQIGQAAAAAGGTLLVVSVLFRHRARRGGLSAEYARFCAADLASGLAGLGLQRSRICAKRQSADKPGPCCRDHQ